jgi:hypothetical protein
MKPADAQSAMRLLLSAVGRGDSGLFVARFPAVDAFERRHGAHAGTCAINHTLKN